MKSLVSASTFIGYIFSIGCALGLMTGFLLSGVVDASVSTDLTWVTGIFGGSVALLVGLAYLPNELKKHSTQIDRTEHRAFTLRPIAVFSLIFICLNVLIQNHIVVNSYLLYFTVLALSLVPAVTLEIILSPVLASYSQDGIIWSFTRASRFIYLISSNIAFLLPLAVWWLIIVRLAEILALRPFILLLTINTFVAIIYAFALNRTPVEPLEKLHPLRSKYEAAYSAWKSDMLGAREHEDDDKVVRLIRANKAHEVALFAYWFYVDDVDAGIWLLRFIEDNDFLRSLILPIRYYDISSSEELRSWEGLIKDLSDSIADQDTDIRGRSLLLIVKRLADVLTTAAFLILVAIPYILLISLLLFIELKSFKKIFFVSYRIGKHGKLYKDYEFRLFRDKRNGMLRPSRLRSPLIWSATYRLPELYNILKGDMSVVGPYPMFELYARYRSSENEENTVKIAKRLSFSPGIIDPTVIRAQLKPNIFRCPVDCLEVHQEYFEKWSLFRDAYTFVRSLFLYFIFYVPNTLASLTLPEKPPPFGTAPFPLPMFFIETDLGY